jgi:hypothetical protein
MSDIPPAAQIERVVQEIDRLIAEMALLRRQVVALNRPPIQARRSIGEAEYFGMWAKRQDMQGQTSREWLESLRARQWARQ